MVRCAKPCDLRAVSMAAMNSELATACMKCLFRIWDYQAYEVQWKVTITDLRTLVLVEVEGGTSNNTNLVRYLYLCPLFKLLHVHFSSCSVVTVTIQLHVDGLIRQKHSFYHHSTYTCTCNTRCQPQTFSYLIEVRTISSFRQGVCQVIVPPSPFHA